jgi:hypothetical protein
VAGLVVEVDLVEVDLVVEVWGGRSLVVGGLCLILTIDFAQ